MPYIKKARRNEIMDALLEGVLPVLNDAGELNFFISTVLIQYIHDRGMRYQTMNDAMGALEGAKLELYRRVIAGYEDDKARDNTDMPWPTS